jgi:hypothetical protein
MVSSRALLLTDDSKIAERMKAEAFPRRAEL